MLGKRWKRCGTRLVVVLENGICMIISIIILVRDLAYAPTPMRHPAAPRRFRSRSRWRAAQTSRARERALRNEISFWGDVIINVIDLVRRDGGEP